MPRRNNRNSDYGDYTDPRARDGRREDARRRSAKNGGRGRERQLSVRSVRRDQPDTRKIARAIIAMALAEAEAEAQAAAQAVSTSASTATEGPSTIMTDTVADDGTTADFNDTMDGDNSSGTKDMLEADL